MVKKVTYAGLIFAVFAAGWVVLFARTPGQVFPREMVWVFYLLVIPIVAQCWILTDKSFWNAVWKDGLPVSPILEKKWSEQYLVIRGMCVQNRRLSDLKMPVEGGKYGPIYKLNIRGFSRFVLCNGIKIGKVLIGVLVAVIVILVITAPTASKTSLSLKGYIATSWPIVWISVVGMQLMLFGFAVFALYWIVAKFVSLFSR
ncbi:hypothetical protein PQQ87_38675 [Paraburkholderia nemoris]|uniref:hypothetical protein n=1 Tax=Paraburkholderia nemoris TaxID=2793076 RepID=UPI0038BA903F